MPETFEQSLDVCRLEFNSLKRFKRKLDENDEYIDVTGCPPAKRANIDLIGGSPEKPASIDRYPPKNLSFSIDQSPSKKIYYDHIGSEFDGGGFFDRDDLDDEDDRDGLVIDCRLNESWEKKTDNGISHDERISNGPDLTEPEVVVNLNVVDVEVVGSEPIDVEALYPDENLTVTEPCNLVNTKVIYDESIDVEKLYPEVTVTGCSSVSISEPINLVDTKVVYNEPIDVEKLYPKVTVPACNSVSIAETINLVDTKVVNNEPIDVEQLYPETETSPDCRPVANNTMSYSFPDRSRSSTRESNLSAVPSTSYHSRRNAASSQPIRSKLRPSAFSAPVKSQPEPQRVPLLPNAGPNQYHQGQNDVSAEYCLTSSLSDLPYNWNNTETCLPPQFGFGPTYLCKSFGSKEKYPPEYYATLNAHARMMEAMSPDELKRYARLILSSTPIPEHTGPPPTAFRPRLVPVKLHPSIFKIHQQQQSREQSREVPKTKPNSSAPAAVSQKIPAPQPPPSISQPQLSLSQPPPSISQPLKAPSTTVLSPLMPITIHPSLFKIHQQQQSREVPKTIPNPSAAAAVSQQAPAHPSSLASLPPSSLSQSLKAPPTVIPSQVPPVKQHPSISSMHQPQQSRALPKSQPYPFAPAAVPRQTPASQPPPSVSQPLKAPPIAAKMPRKMQSQKAPDSSASAVASRRQQQQQAAFSSIYERNHQTMAEHINQVINEFFDHRRNEVFNLVKMCTTRNVYSMDFLIEKLGHLRVSVNRDYVRMAETMIERYRYRYRPGVPRCWVEPATQAQDFQDYFEKVFEYQPKAEEMLGIYKVVIEGLLQQYRGSIEHFLTSNLER